MNDEDISHCIYITLEQVLLGGNYRNDRNEHTHIAIFTFLLSTLSLLFKKDA